MREPTTRHRCPLAAAMIVAGLCCALVAPATAQAAWISEISFAADAGRPPYVEISLADQGQTIDLLVLDGRTDNERRIIERIAVQPDPPIGVVVLHQGTWPSALPPSAQAIGVESLELGEDDVGASRRLALVSAGAMASDESTVPPLDDWPVQPIDVVSYTTNPAWSIRAAFGEPLLIELGKTHAAWRHRVGDTFTAAFTRGPIDADGRFADGHTQDPGLVNRATDVPEPTGLLLLALAALPGTLGRRPRHAPTP